MHRCCGGYEVAGCDGDLNCSVQKSCSANAVRGLSGQAALNDPLRLVEVTLGESKQGRSSAVSTRQLTGPSECCLGAVQVTEPAPYVSDVRVGRHRVRQVAVQQLSAGSGRLTLSLFERSTAVEHNCPVDPANAREYGIRVTRRP
jgi:hypothetical protein